MANDNNNFKIQLFEGQKVRTAWSEEEQQWYFSIIDICWILTESKDYDTARKYWNKLKQRLIEEGNESVTNCHQLKLVSPKDGKRYLTDDQVRDLLLQLSHTPTIAQFQQLPLTQQTHYILQASHQGAAMKKLSRPSSTLRINVTGIKHLY